ncbi:sulfotransferase [Flagellimonas meishanensis]|uniref:sulfotransferase n=1 Tax=Flagellimonas meishanensis TaxID=2873264 RepID=UPI001CA60193|nr:sulfotransferase [[Muricauda] meishanensis]
MKEQVSINCIYLLGAGRSGTTLLATVMNSHKDILTLGEMNQFYEYVAENKPVSSGALILDCEYWGEVVQRLDMDVELAAKLNQISKEQEHHSKTIKWLLTKSSSKIYFEYQNSVFQSIRVSSPGKWFLDSSKYISRYLLLGQNRQIRTKGIYVVRDVRGVIHSFSKKVQTSRSPLSAILYYTAINFLGQMVCWVDRKVIKIKYEDFMDNPEMTLAKIYNHIFDNGTSHVSLPASYEMPIIIGGNRMKANKSVAISKDIQWKKKMTRTQQICYYLFAFPLMILNGYKM